MTMTITTTMLPNMTGRSAAADRLPQPRRGASWRWSAPTPARGGGHPSRVLLVTRVIARHRYHLRR
jgi:hypothetical protein